MDTRNRPILTILKSVTPLAATDTLGRALDAMRVSGVTELPVFDFGRLIGMVSEAGILSVLVKSGGDPSASAKSVREAVTEPTAFANPYMSIGQVAETMDSRGVQVLPVIDEYGRYLGVVARPDLTAVLTHSIRPPSIAGLATPLGVYLSTGHIRAGASDFGLFLSGASLMLLNYLSIALIAGMAWAVEHGTGAKLFTILMSQVHPAPWMETAQMIMVGLSLPLFLVLLRAAPLSGFHGAEHQVVHAIERGEPLKPEIVKSMPRVHPRCGTNLVTAVILFILVSEIFGADIVAMVTIFVMVFAWRAIGGYFQYYVTTKPATAKQLDSGIRAGESLLEQFRENPAYQVIGWRRVWNTGMPQVMLGAASMTSVGVFLHKVAPTLF